MPTTRPTPLPTRVTPFGSIVAVALRYDRPSARIGNRGVIHDASFRLTHQWKSRAWLVCEIDTSRTRSVQRDDNRAFNGRKRQVFTPGRWSELFFLDECVAFAAGHRPCACCRNQDYKAFLRAWSFAHPRSKAWTAAEVDAVLHAERLECRHGSKRLHAMPSVANLPDGVMVLLQDEAEAVQSSEGGKDVKGRQVGSNDESAWLVWNGALHRWTHAGYVGRTSPIPDRPCSLLTPPSLVAVIEHGFTPGPPHSSVFV